MGVFIVALLALSAVGFRWGWRVGITVVIVSAAVLGWVLEQPLAALCVELIAVPLAILSWPPLVEPLVRHVMDAAPRMAISDTERMALAAGGPPGFEAGLMRGTPDWTAWLETPTPSLTPSEKAFLDGPVEDLCRSCTDWSLSQSKTIPAETWELIKTHKMFGLVIPVAHGGLGFSTYAHHKIITKIASVSATLASTIGVPNSLGPAELLVHYGTPEQKSHWLPRLASATDIPCFALTSWQAGSDAGSLQDIGVVGRRAGPDSDLGLWVTFDKRYITLAPIATLIGVACKVSDPEQLLGGGVDLGITLVLVPRSSDGLVVGRTHSPMDTALSNGPVSGRVFVPMSHVIGGRSGVGVGWKMLMDCLSVGRSVTLPSVATGTSALAAATTGAYVQVRYQFGQPLIQFEGIQDAWLHVVSSAYTIKALAAAVAYSVDRGEHPSVGSAVAKYHATQKAQSAISTAVDIHGGRAVQAGPSNYLAIPFQASPISITVEGANILTRNVMIYAPALVKCHPTLSQLMDVLERPASSARFQEFQRLLFIHLKHAVRSAGRSLWRSFAQPSVIDEEHDIMAAVDRYAAALSWCNEAVLLSYGSDLKRREAQSARLGDALSSLWMASAVMRQYRWDERPAGDEGLMRYTASSLLRSAHTQLADFITQLPPTRRWLWRITTRLSRSHQWAWPDKERLFVAKETTHGARHRLAQLACWPIGSSATRMHTCVMDAPFMERLRTHTLTSVDQAAWKSLLAVDDFDPRP